MALASLIKHARRRPPFAAAHKPAPSADAASHKPPFSTAAFNRMPFAAAAFNRMPFAAAYKPPPPPNPAKAVFLRHFKPHEEDTKKFVEESAKKYTDIWIKDLEKRGIHLAPENHSILKQFIERRLDVGSVEEMVQQLHKTNSEKFEDIIEEMDEQDVNTKQELDNINRRVVAIEAASTELSKLLRDYAAKPRPRYNVVNSMMLILVSACYVAVAYISVRLLLRHQKASVEVKEVVKETTPPVEVAKTLPAAELNKQKREEVRRVAAKDVPTS